MLRNPSLLEAQRALHRAIVQGDSQALQGLVAADSLAIADAIDIYANTIRWTLTRALRLSHPAVHRLVGAEFFDGTADQFLRRHWPQTACLDDFGADFAQFLDTFEPARDLVYLSDVARLEWAVHQALHATEAPALPLEQLLQLEKDQCAALRFTANPSLHLILVHTPADEIWRAVLQQDDSALASIEVKRAPRHLLIQRDAEGAVQVSALAECEWSLLRALSSGVTLERALRKFCAAAPGFDLDRVLAQHLAAGRFTDFTLTSSGADSPALDALN